MLLAMRPLVFSFLLQHASSHSTAIFDARLSGKIPYYVMVLPSLTRECTIWRLLDKLRKISIVGDVKHISNPQSQKLFFATARSWKLEGKCRNIVVLKCSFHHQPCLRKDKLSKIHNEAIKSCKYKKSLKRLK